VQRSTKSLEVTVETETDQAGVYQATPSAFDSSRGKPAGLIGDQTDKWRQD
jgi:hypothetical protein